MSVEPLSQVTSGHGAPPCSESARATALVLEGPPSLSAYRTGVLRALCEGGPKPCWTLGTGFGACYAALIAGNPPGERLSRIAQFSEAALPLVERMEADARPSFWSAWLRGTLRIGQSALRTLPARDAAEQLHAVLPPLIDLARINGAETHLSLGARDRTNNAAIWFDNSGHAITIEEIIAATVTPLREPEAAFAALLAAPRARPEISRIACDVTDAGSSPASSPSLANTLFALIYGATRAAAPVAA